MANNSIAADLIVKCGRKNTTRDERKNARNRKKRQPKKEVADASFVPLVLR